MEEKFGLIKGIECGFVKADPELTEQIANKRGIDPDKVKEMLRYNIFTVGQFSELTGLTVSTVHNKIRPVLKNDQYSTDLNFCHPFAGIKEKGPRFIVRDEKAENFLKA
jgi:hypothetical protein